MLFEILGPLRARDGDREVAISAGRERVVLAVLLLSSGAPVPVETLVAAVWGEQPPSRPRTQLQGCVARLRRQLAGASVRDQVILTDPVGYRIASAGVDVDLVEFRRQLARARGAAAEGRSDAAAAHYRAGLGLWRGPVLAGIDSQLVRRMTAAVEEERMQALEERIRLDLEAGRAAPLVAELTGLVQEHPYREALHGALMLALYRSGRQADALAAYRRAHQILQDELGAEPGGELQRLHRTILNHGPDLEVGPPQPPAARPATELSVPRELPAPVAGFTGRDAALETLDRWLPDEPPAAAPARTPAPAPAPAPVPVPVIVVSGTAGVGKTALALHWAHRLVDRYPDGQLYLDLQGFSFGPPLSPLEALTALMRSVGAPADQIPTDLAQATARYRSLLAGRRVLLVLDNAGSVDQVRPLLPGWSGCLVLVTSRERLSGLVARDGARRLALDVLAPADAQALLTRLLGAERVQGEAEAVAELARSCAHLPLALRIVAAHLGDRPHRTAADLAAELAAGDRLAAMTAEGDEDTAVRVALDVSYQRLPAAAQRLFRLLGLVPGPDVTVPAAAALAGTGVGQARQLLERLVRAHLLEEHAPGRFSFHDLLRLYARQRATIEEPDRAAAVRRLLGWYLHTTHAAVVLLYPHMLELPTPPAELAGPPAGIDGTDRAMAWLDAERTNLVAAVAYGASEGPRPLAWQLAGCLRRYFLHNGHTWQWRTVTSAAVAATAAEGDDKAQAAARLGLADLSYHLVRLPEAAEHYRAALELSRRAGWEEAELAVLTNMGRVYRSQGRLGPAVEQYQRLLARYRRRGAHTGAAISHNMLGCVERERGRLADAARHHGHALEVYRRLEYPVGVADARSGLAEVHHDLGLLASAREHLTEALRLHREIGDSAGAAIDLHRLAGVQCDLGRVDEAIDLAEAAVAESAADPANHAQALNTRGCVLLRLDRPEPAGADHRQALALARQISGRYPEVVALLGMAAVELRLDRHHGAADHAAHAHRLACETGYRLLEAVALTTLAEICLGQREHDRAYDFARRALERHRSVGHRLGEARTLALLARPSRARPRRAGPG